MKLDLFVSTLCNLIKTITEIIQHNYTHSR